MVRLGFAVSRVPKCDGPGAPTFSGAIHFLGTWATRLDALAEDNTSGLRRILHRHGEASLQQLAGGEVANEATVGGEEVVAGEVFKADPADLLVDLVVDFADELMHGKEL
jgi:hypothetical protein